MLNDPLGGTANQQMGQPGPSVRPDDDKLKVLFLGNAADLLEREAGDDFAFHAKPRVFLFQPLNLFAQFLRGIFQAFL